MFNVINYHFLANWATLSWLDSKVNISVDSDTPNTVMLLISRLHFDCVAPKPPPTPQLTLRRPLEMNPCISPSGCKPATHSLGFKLPTIGATLVNKVASTMPIRLLIYSIVIMLNYHRQHGICTNEPNTTEWWHLVSLVSSPFFWLHMIWLWHVLWVSLHLAC